MTSNNFDDNNLDEQALSGENMSKHILKTCLSGAVIVGLLGGVVYFSNQSVVENIAKNKPNSDAKLSAITHAGNDIRPTQINPSSKEKDTRYQGPAEETETNIVSLSLHDYHNLSVYGPLPESLKGVSIPKLYTDKQGNLIQDKSAKEFIEFFVSGAREEGTQTSLDRMKEYFKIALEEPARSQARALLNNYMNYRFQLDSVVSRDNIVTQDDKLSALKEALLQRQRLRKEALGEQVAQAMFGESEKYEDYTVKVMETSQDSSLSPEQKSALYAQYEENLPSHIKQRVRHERKERELQHQVNLLKQQGNKEAEIYALRKDAYGEKYAQTWAFMEDNSDEWTNKVALFNQEKEQILASIIVPDDYKRRQINSLKEQVFSEDEQLKLQWQALQ